MRKVAAVGLAIVAMTGSSVFAGTATFTQSPQPDVLLGTPTVTMELTITATQLPNFDGADIIINSDAPFTFAYSDAFKTAANAFQLYADSPANTIAGVPVGIGLKPFDLYVAGAAGSAGGLGTSIDMGKITFDTAALGLGTYDAFVSSDADGLTTSITRVGPLEGIEGRGSFTIVPEPATIGLLVLGGLGTLLRRRVAG